jgi:hypothetical protein
MPPTPNTPSANNRVQYAELLNLAATIDRYGQAQQLPGNVRAGLSFITIYTLFDAVPAIEEDYSDLSPNPPQDLTAWRGAQFRLRRNAAAPGGADAGDLATGAAPAADAAPLRHVIDLRE